MEQGNQTVHLTKTYRWIENAHILLWLIKDACWGMEFKAGGYFMIAPTLIVAYYLTWRSRKVITEFCHNISVCFWIMANSVWMIGEFREQDTRPYAVMLFGAGLATLAVYYIFFFKKERDKENEYELQ